MNKLAENIKKIEEKLKIKIGEEFKPALTLKKIYYIYLILGILAGFLTWYIPVLLFAPFKVTLGISIPILAVLIFISFWIPRYYDTVVYKLTDDEIIWRRGVWFKTTGVVPYNRITNIDVSQGPISRTMRIATLMIHTAGYSGQTAAEIKIVGIEQFEELRELILNFVKGKKPLAVETYEKEDIELKIFEELVEIRKLLKESLIK